MNRRRWRVLVALWLIVFFNFGFSAYAPAVLNPAMARALGLNGAALGSLFAVYMLLSALPGPLVGLCINRLGSRWTLVLGSALICCGSLLMATVVSNFAAASLCFGGLVGVGNVTGSLLPAQAMLTRWFVRRRSLAMAALYSAGAVGGFIAAPWVGHLVQEAGSWRAGWWAVAAASGMAGSLAVMLVPAMPPTEPALPLSDEWVEIAARSPSFVSTRNWTFRQIVACPTYWAMLAAFLGASGGNTVFLAHGVAHLENLGHSVNFAAWSVSTMTASGLAGKVLLAVCGDRLDPRWLLAAFLMSSAVGLTLLSTAAGAAQALLAATCLGIGFGGGFVCLMTVISNYYGVQAFPVLSGLTTAIPTAISAVVSSVAGHLADIGQGYALTFYALASCCVAGAAALLLVRAPTIDGATYPD